MFDRHIRHLIDAPLTRAGALLARTGPTANVLTIGGLCFGLAAAVAIYQGQPLLALALFAVNRLADGLDGALARQSRATVLGGFLDICCDFAVYGAIPLAFAALVPAENALPACVLLFSFYINGATFLAFSTVAVKLGLETTAQGQKSIYYVAGLAEGGETIVVFALMMLMPALFPPLAWGFAALTLLSAVFRLILGWTTFRPGA